MRISACVLALLVATFPAAVLALGLGNVEISTTLNEPLRAKIPLTRVRPGEVDAIDVRLGSQAHFQRAGLERPFYLSQLKFRVVPGADGGAHVEITTQNAVTEPFLNFLVEVNWPSGRLIREYTLLLDPPVYGAAISTATKSTMATVEALPDAGEAVAVTGTTAPRPTPTSPAPTMTGAVAPPALAGVDSYGPVAEQETLWSIASRVRPDESVSVQRMMLAILDANPGAFIINNVNALRKGAVLRIPDRGEIGADDKDAAMAEVRRQQALWDEYRGQVAGAPARMPEGAAAPAIGAPEAERAPVSDEGSRLELVAAGQAEGAGAPGEAASVATLRKELNLALEEADSKQRENQELSERLAETERLVSDLSRMLELKDDEIARLQESLRAREQVAAADPQPETMPEPQPAPEAAAPEPAPEPAPPPAPAPAPVAQPAPPPAQPASFVDEVLNSVRGFLPKDIYGFDPILVVGGGLGLLLILGGAGALVRRRQAAQAETSGALAVGEGESMIERYAAESDEGVTEVPAGPAPDEVDEDATVLADSDDVTEVPVAGDVKESPEDDTLGELNVYMAYEHFDQAEQLVRGAVAEHPERHEYRLKLLGVLAAAKNLPSFQKAARELRELVGEDSPMIQSAAEMWNEIAPGRDMFAEAQAPETGVDEAAGDDVFDVTSGDDEDSGTGVDFDLGFELTSAEDAESESADSGVDFDLGGMEETPADEAAQADTDELDFDFGDITGTGDDESAEAAGKRETDVDDAASDLDIDLTGADVPEGSAEDDGEGLDFDLSSGDAADEAVEEAPPAGDEGLDFDFSVEEAPAGPTDEAPETGQAGGDTADTAEASPDDSGLDFDIGVDEPEEDTGAGVSGVGDDSKRLSGGDVDAPAADLGLDFDIGGDEPEAGAEDETSRDDDDRTGLSGGDADASADLGLDFDIGGDDTGSAEEKSGEASGLDFDIGGGTEDAVNLETGEDSDESAGLGLDAGAPDDADFNLFIDEADAPGESAGGTEEDFEATQFMLEDDEQADVEAGDEDDKTIALGKPSGDVDDIQTKLDLAEAYIEMGDTDDARRILGEVMSEGSDEQKEQANNLLSKLD